jgi:hypothetical protein
MLVFPTMQVLLTKEKQVLTLVNPSHTLYHGSSIEKWALFANPSSDYYFWCQIFAIWKNVFFEKNLEILKHKMCFSSNLYNWSLL